MTGVLDAPVALPEAGRNSLQSFAQEGQTIRALTGAPWTLGQWSPMRTVSFVPPMVNTSDPDIDEIHAAVDKALDPPKKDSGKK